MPKFKVKDIVKFKDPASENANFFKKGLTNLIIVAVDGTNPINYRVEESNGSTAWWVYEHELEFQTPRIKLKLRKLV